MKLESFRLPKNHLLLLQIGVFAYLVLTAIKGNWYGDFWQHAAIVKQFSTLHADTHPIFNIETPHPFYTPYHFVIGICVKLLETTVIQELTFAGLVNAALLLYLFPKFVEVIFKSKEIAFYSLLFALFFWLQPYYYSGFISINVLSSVISYPSTFTLILTFALFILFDLEKTKIITRYLILSFSTGFILISHPLTGIITCLGLFFIHLNKYGITLSRSWGFFASSIILAFILAIIWPYYPFWDLIMGAGDIFHESNKAMYDNPLFKTFPAILAIPFMLISLKKKESRWLIYLFASLLIVYLFGFFSEKWSFGRVISFMAIICQIYLAKAFVEAKAWIGEKYKIRWLPTSLIFIVLGLVIYKKLNFSDFLPLDQRGISAQKYEDLSAHLSEEDIVFATEGESSPLPTFGPKIVSFYPQAFIEDGGQARRMDTYCFFFEENCSDSSRWEIIEKYEVNKILLAVDFKKM